MICRTCSYISKQIKINNTIHNILLEVVALIMSIYVRIILQSADFISFHPLPYILMAYVIVSSVRASEFFR